MFYMWIYIYVYMCIENVYIYCFIFYIIFWLKAQLPNRRSGRLAKP